MKATLALRLLQVLVLAALSATATTLQAGRDRPPSSSGSHRFASKPEVRQFIEAMVAQHGFMRRELETLFSKAEYRPDIIRAMTPPLEAPARSWQAYRAMFVNAQRIDAGLRFRALNAAALQRAAAEFGVPEEIILAIIGVETVYGRNMGRYRVIDALSTLAFDFPRRAEFFRAELESFLLFARESRMDALAIRGSYAGAIGIPQFMPGSYRRFAVDYDGDGRADLVESPADAIGSVANFLRSHGWMPGQPVAFKANVEGDDWKKLVAAGVKPAWRIADLPAMGVAMAPQSTAGLAPDTLATLVELETAGQATAFWVGLQNFYALTRYNRSNFYAIAVLEFSQALREGFPAPAPQAPQSP